MPRKNYVADLQATVLTFSKPNVSEVRPGDEDGTMKFNYHLEVNKITEITMLVPDLDEYPGSHAYMVYTNSESVPPAIHTALDSMDISKASNVMDAITHVVTKLDKASEGSRFNPVDLDNNNLTVIDVDSDEEMDTAGTNDGLNDDMDSNEGDWSPRSPKYDSNRSHDRLHSLAGNPKLRARIERLLHDLKVAKAAGFRVNAPKSLLQGRPEGIVTISIRVHKLGISREALRAWHIEPFQYLMLLIRFTAGYLSLDEVHNDRHGQTVSFRVGITESYNLPADDARSVFYRRKRTTEEQGLSAKASNHGQGFSEMFISRPLDELLNDRLLPFLRYRLAMGFSWDCAEVFFNDHQGRNLTEIPSDPRYRVEDFSDSAKSLPAIVMADHLKDAIAPKSFILLAMQLLMRHTVRCTEFCLVCHEKIQVNFEALKPYVCSKPLCLYQYMSIGLGPSIEHEILTQPLVVDLLISLCYNAAVFKRLAHPPKGLALTVPSPTSLPGAKALAHDPTASHSRQADTGLASKVTSANHRSAAHDAKFDPVTRDLLFAAGERPPLFKGTWIIYSLSHSPGKRYHASVIEVMFPTVRLSKAISEVQFINTDNASITPPIPSTMAPQQLSPIKRPPAAEASSSGLEAVKYQIYDHNFDDCDALDKQRLICYLLDTLPKVAEMQSFLKDGHGNFLHTWSDRISPAALGILRWIIASNRSCIVQVDARDNSARSEKIIGFSGWAQFRFAQGSPDKEHRFNSSIQDTTSNEKYPTLFAWHGSPLHNWHGIVREGLHFERTDHGRAYGNGVYHALDAQTSLAYSTSRTQAQTPFVGETKEPSVRFGHWIHSDLQIEQVLALNEIVNAPEKFVSRSPHLVISQLDWIQTRYLFVKCLNENKEPLKESRPVRIIEQDPSYTPLGKDRAALIIPLHAVSQNRRPTPALSIANGNKKLKVEGADDQLQESILSDATDVEDDLTCVVSHTEADGIESQDSSKGRNAGKSERVAPSLSNASFVPGIYEYQSLPLTVAPSYATSSATRTLQKELSNTLKVQGTRPLEELGWYIDPELVTNVYQWIVELHSFESHLPLARDMRDRKLQSILVEIRFGKDYPITPPFVRVIRPRFLSFQFGGGGHVTAGGALCMELLTNTGWSAANNIESILLQIRLAMSSVDPKPARLDPGAVKDYGVGEAVEAFLRACKRHGWEIPPDFKSSFGEGSKSKAP